MPVFSFRVKPDSGVQVDPDGLICLPRRVVTAVRLQHMHGVVDVAAAIVVIDGMLPQHVLLLLVPVSSEMGPATSVSRMRGFSLVPYFLAAALLLVTNNTVRRSDPVTSPTASRDARNGSDLSNMFCRLYPDVSMNLIGNPCLFVRGRLK